MFNPTPIYQDFIIVQEEKPKSSFDGQIWVRTSDGATFQYFNGVWEQIGQEPDKEWIKLNDENQITLNDNKLDNRGITHITPYVMKGWEEIEESPLTSSFGNTETFNIESNYDLFLLMPVSGDTGEYTIRMRINGDTGNNYDSMDANRISVSTGSDRFEPGILDSDFSEILPFGTFLVMSGRWENKFEIRGYSNTGAVAELSYGRNEAVESPLNSFTLDMHAGDDWSNLELRIFGLDIE